MILPAPVCHVAVAQSERTLRQAKAMLDEMILMALVPGPLKARELRAAVAPFGYEAVTSALTRLIAVGEIAREGNTVSRIYRLVQRTATPTEPRQPALPAPAPIVRADGVEYESVWPLPDNPKAPPRVLCDRRMSA